MLPLSEGLIKTFHLQSSSVKADLGVRLCYSAAVKTGWLLLTPPADRAAAHSITTTEQPAVRSSPPLHHRPFTTIHLTLTKEPMTPWTSYVSYIRLCPQNIFFHITASMMDWFNIKQCLHVTGENNDTFDSQLCSTCQSGCTVCPVHTTIFNLLCCYQCL